MRGRPTLRAWLVTTVAAFAALLASCTSVEAQQADRAVLPIWDVRAARMIDASELIARVANARYRLLGEVHDNPAHHRFRARLLDALGQAGKRPAVLFEQFDLAADAALRDAQQRGADAEALATAGGLDRDGWRWPMHKPLIEAALREHMPVYAANAARATLGAVMKTGDASGLDSALTTRLAQAPWTAEQAALLADDIRESHCNKLPADAVPRLALAQRVRDAAMAEAMVRDATADGAVLIAGNGHVRRDLGVPVYLGAPAQAIVAVGWVEASADEMGATDFPRSAANARPGFDYLWFTSAVERPDPCAAMQGR